MALSVVVRGGRRARTIANLGPGAAAKACAARAPDQTVVSTAWVEELPLAPGKKGKLEKPKMENRGFDPRTSRMHRCEVCFRREVRGDDRSIRYIKLWSYVLSC